MHEKMNAILAQEVPQKCLVHDRTLLQARWLNVRTDFTNANLKGEFVYYDVT